MTWTLLTSLYTSLSRDQLRTNSLRWRSIGGLRLLFSIRLRCFSFTYSQFTLSTLSFFKFIDFYFSNSTVVFSWVVRYLFDPAWYLKVNVLFFIWFNVDVNLLIVYFIHNCCFLQLKCFLSFTCSCIGICIKFVIENIAVLWFFVWLGLSVCDLIICCITHLCSLDN